MIKENLNCLKIYHILDFRNYNHDKQEKGNESIKYETDANIFEKSVPKKPM